MNIIKYFIELYDLKNNNLISSLKMEKKNHFFCPILETLCHRSVR